ncbi:Lipid A export ATP-binding/permease protein MsbA [Propionispora sp. 2/2-37]|uniref:lipid A export permease/ATP-binding protein MsbA n=1 Tax=Propionispora sp. 2/2-37 TaxID=1677858 RepID=UPI0006BB81BF|nr:lipid A export permease/ATP-binding protein MsbA [Propionispora sp. 2/2-37]CUH94531.1 Lipid A export ATP-binding/permease protein MsbA [Propionispora sp. 2/2-37]
MNTYIRLLNFIRPYIPRLILAVFCIMFAAGTNLYIPWIMQDVIDKVLAEKDMTMLNIIAGGIVVVFVLRGIFFYGQTYLMAYIGQKVIIDIRGAVYRHMQRLPLSYYEKRQTGTLMSYITNDVAALQNALVDNVIEGVTEGMTLIGSLGAMFYIHWKLALLTIVTVPLVAQTINIFGKKLRKASHVMQERAADITSILQETLSAARVIKSFVREEHEIDRFDKQNYKNFRAQMKTAQLMALLTPIIEFLAAVAVTLIIWYGGWEVINDHLTAGSLVAFLIYAVNLSNPIKRLSRVYGGVQRSLAAAQRIFAVLDTEPDIKDMPDAVSMPRIQGEVEFHQVNFSYKTGEPVLQEVSLQAKPGQMVAIVGPSGAGKTTVANLIPRFYDPGSGYISIDGIDIKTVTLDSLREQIGIVPQETVLFNGTVYENILYGRLDACEEEVVAAAKAANAHHFISQMPEEYDTQIGERGSKLSGGQRQRIAIARAILKNPRVLILDEATSALDTESEKLVQEALDKLMAGRTSFVIAHRLSTIKRADMILVLEKGRIVERGTHDELLALNGVYHKLHQVQFSGNPGNAAAVQRK